MGLKTVFSCGASLFILFACVPKPSVQNTTIPFEQPSSDNSGSNVKQPSRPTTAKPTPVGPEPIVLIPEPDERPSLLPRPIVTLKPNSSSVNPSFGAGNGSGGGSGNSDTTQIPSNDSEEELTSYDFTQDLIPKLTSIPVTWKINLPADVTINEAAPLLHDGQLYIVTQSGKIFSLNAVSGQVSWQSSQFTAFETTPLLGPDGVIYLGGSNGTFYAIEATGQVKWTFTPDEPNSFRLGGAALDETGVLYTGGTSEALYALNSSDGSEIWRYQARAPIDNAPVVTEDRVYFLALDQTLYALNRANGEYLWEFQTGQPISDLSPALTDHEDIVFGSADPWLYSLNRHGLENWSFVMKAGLSASPVIGPDGTVYAPTANGIFYALNNLGELIWELNLGSRIQAAPVIGKDGVVYVGTSAGKIFSVFPNGTYEWIYQANGSIQGRLLLDERGRLYCVSDQGQVVALQTGSQGLAEAGWPMESGNSRAWGRK